MLNSTAFLPGAKRRKATRASPEHDLQVTVAQYLAIALRPPTFWSSIDHGAGRMTRASAGLRKARGLASARLVPDDPFTTYGIGCITPENSSDLINIVNLAIAKQQAGYLEGRPDAVASVDPWIGPTGVLGIPAERIRTFFQSNLLSRESLLLLEAAKAKAAP